ncbi:hypothetical protein SRHO_G00019240 [Serrasalmus rhombeus]
MKRNLLIILIITPGVFAADQIGPSGHQETVFRKEGESVTLNCSYDTSSENVALYWYRQSPNRALQFILGEETTREPAVGPIALLSASRSTSEFGSHRMFM